MPNARAVRWLLVLAALTGACGNGRIGNTLLSDAGIATAGSGGGTAGVTGSAQAGTTGGASAR